LLASQCAARIFDGGVTTYLDVITAQTTLLTNQRLATQLLGQQMVIRSSGKGSRGGWDASEINREQVHPRLARSYSHKGTGDPKFRYCAAALLRLAPIPLTIAAIQPKIVIEVVLLLNLILS